MTFPSRYQQQELGSDANAHPDLSQRAQARAPQKSWAWWALDAVARSILGTAAGLVYYSTLPPTVNVQQLSFGFAVTAAVIVLTRDRPPGGPQ